MTFRGPISQHSRTVNQSDGMMFTSGLVVRKHRRAGAITRLGHVARSLSTRGLRARVRSDRCGLSVRGTRPHPRRCSREGSGVRRCRATSYKIVGCNYSFKRWTISGLKCGQTHNRLRGGNGRKTVPASRHDRRMKET